jgi:cytochrome c
VTVQTEYKRFALLLIIASSAGSSAALAAENPAEGKAQFETCAACHSLQPDQNGVGPTLHGLFGRKSASEDFNYSPAMRRAKVTWTPELLDHYLTDPQAGVFKGNRMPFAGLPDAQARANLIAYLKEATK